MTPACAILCLASLLAPREQRAEWLAEWRSELWYIPRGSATLFCLGAFQDALCLRRNSPAPVTQARLHLQSPIRCLAFLAVLATLSIFVVFRVPGPASALWPSHLRARHLLPGLLAMLFFSCVLLPATRFAMGRVPFNPHATPWQCKLRRGMFMALKIALMQPIMLGGFFALVLVGPVLPLAPVGLFSLWILIFRWMLIDQRGRCPVCLRLLTDPVRIGSPSQTFLEWYGAESICARGHGMLYNPELVNGCYCKEWLNLDGSWGSLFAEAAEVRQP